MILWTILVWTVSVAALAAFEAVRFLRAHARRGPGG